MSFNACGIWTGERESLRSPGDVWTTAEIEIARTPNGFEFCTHVMGGGYGIGFHEGRFFATREAALAAAVVEVRSEIAQPRDRMNGLGAVPAIRRWLDDLAAPLEQPDLFSEVDRAAA